MFEANTFISQNLEFHAMSEYDENLRVVFQLAHERNEKLISYVHLTDGAIWGFLGLIFVQFFNDYVNFESNEISLFCLLLIVSMFLWRDRVTSYQNGIVKGYNRMVRCEYDLDIPYDITIRKNLCIDINENILINPKPKTFSALCNLLDPKKYKDPRHARMDWVALFFSVFAIAALFYLFNRQFQCFNPYILGFLGVIVIAIFFWLYNWRFFTFRYWIVITRL
jgi:hypothetical protein